MIAAIVKNYQAVFMFAILILIMGFVSYQSLPRESSPEIRRPMIFVTTFYPGVSASDMEQLITIKIEDELDGLTGLEKISSESQLGVSNVTAEFSSDTEVEIALRRVRERVDIAKTKIPENAEEPIVKELNFSDQPIVIVTLSHPSGLETLEPFIDTIEDEILGINGVLDVEVSGRLARELAIEVDPNLLQQFSFSLDQVIQAIQAEHVTIPGGELKTKDKNYTINVTGEIKQPEEFKDIVVKKDAKRIRLGDLAKVSFQYKAQESLARLNGEPAVSYAVKKRSGKNIIQVVDKVKEIFAKQASMLPQGTQVNYSFDQSDEIRRMVADLENNIYSGLVLVLVVTFFFLGPINATFVSMAIPFSMLASFFVLQIYGITLNMVVLFSLIIALGMLVDNGIVIVENIYRHAAMGKNRVDAAIDGTKEIAWPITTSTITTVLAFFPIIFMPDIMGEFMSYLPKTVIIVLTASLVTALTITTVVCSKFLRINAKEAEKMQSGSGQFQRFLRRYEGVLRRVLQRPILSVLATTAFVFVGMILYGKFGKETLFFPNLDPRVAVIDVELPNGSPLAHTDLFVQKLEGHLQQYSAYIDHLQTTVGMRSGGRNFESNRANIRVGFFPFEERTKPSTELIEQMKAELAAYPGANVKIGQMQEGPPTGHPISYEITGNDYVVLGKISDEIMAILEQHKAKFETYDTDYEAIKPEMRIQINREMAARSDLDTRVVASTIRSAINGSIAGKYRWNKEEYDIMVRYQDPYRNTPQALDNLDIVADGKRMPLSTFANVYESTSVNVIKRKNRYRAVNLWADFKVDVEDKAEVTSAIAAKMKELSIPAGYKVSAGEGEAVRNEAQTFLGQAFLVALLLIFMVMVIQFSSMYQPLVVMASVFLSLGGVFWGLFIFRNTFVVIMTGIGIISLAGVAVNNAIVLIDFINQMRGKYESPLEAVVAATLARVRPVLLTAITTVIGLLPMAFGVSLDFHNMTIAFKSESTEWWAPMALSIIYGLSFTTVLTLFVVPVLCYWQLQRQHNKLMLQTNT